jgi:hypothetical protein
MPRDHAPQAGFYWLGNWDFRGTTWELPPCELGQVSSSSGKGQKRGVPDRPGFRHWASRLFTNAPKTKSTRSHKGPLGVSRS